MQIDVIEEVKGTQFMQCKLYIIQTIYYPGMGAGTTRGGVLLPVLSYRPFRRGP